MGRAKLWVAACAIAMAAVLVPVASATTPLSVSKTAEGHWTRAFEWSIDKSVAPDSHALASGQSGTSTYTVAVVKSAGADEVFVDGEVCVQNNGSVPTENLTINDRIRASVDGGSLTLASGLVDTSANPVLDPGESHCYSYEFAIGPVADATYSNDARVTITNDAREPGTPLGPSTSAPFDLPASPTVVNGTVTVEDTNGMSWSFSASGSESYSRTFACDGDEGEHENTATIVETGQADSASVTVTCTPPPEPGCTLTQGHWKTHSKYGPATPTDPTWALIGEDTPFFQSGLSWYQAINASSARGNAYFILAHQYIAAQLNVLAGAATTPAVDAALTWAESFFSSQTPTSTLTKADRAAAIARAELLAGYNEGAIGPGHC